MAADLRGRHPHRRRARGLGPEQRLGGEVALAAATGRGVRPRVGGRADLAILDVDPLAAPPGTRVAGTLIAGEWTHLAMD